MTTPFFSNAASAAATARPGLAIALPFPVGSGAAGTTTTVLKPRNSSQVLAIAAAAAIEDRAAAFEVARQAKENPEDVLVLAFDETKVNALLAAVQVAQDDPGKDYEINAVNRAVAGAIGANPRLVAAAESALDATNSADARLWAVRLIDPNLLDRAARAAGRAEALQALDTGSVASGTNARLKKLEDDRDATNKKLDELVVAVEEIKKRLPAPVP